MIDISKRKADRLRLINAIYEHANGSPLNHVDIEPLMKKLDMPDEEMAAACDYLEGEGLINPDKAMWGHFSPIMVRLTHLGIKEMEQSLETPDQPTEHFPAYISVINITGNLIDSPIIAGNQNTTVSIKHEGDKIRKFISALEGIKNALELSTEKQNELKADIVTIKTQIASPNPKRTILHESLQSIIHVLEGAAGNVTASTLLEIAKHIKL
jgi:hypothetical protein